MLGHTCLQYYMCINTHEGLHKGSGAMSLSGEAPLASAQQDWAETQLRLQVYQTISAYTSRLDNVVELYSKLPVPSLPGFSRSEPVITTATLRHAFEPIGGSTSQITFEDTEIKTTGAYL